MSRTTCRRFASLILGITIPLLQSTFELAVDGGQIIVRQFPPFLFDLSFNLFPISFNTVPVHGDTRVRQRLDGCQVPSVGRSAIRSEGKLIHLLSPWVQHNARSDS